MKKLGLIFILAAALFVTSCQVRVTDNFSGSKFENKVGYFQDQKTGEVFAFVIVAKKLSAVQEGVGLAHIPRNEVTEEIKAQIKNYQE
jgi:hypothetical protein